MNQRTLFDLDALDPLPSRGRIDDESEALLARYRAHHRGSRSARAIEGEVSQLRTVVREAARRGSVRSLAEVLADTRTIAVVLTTPRKQPSASTALLRLGAVNAAILMLYGPGEGRRRIRELDGLLPQRDGADWYQSAAVLAGDPKRRRAQSVTIEPDDLPHIIEAATGGKRTAHLNRDRLLVATACFSGLSAAEIRLLRWRELRWESAAESWSVAATRAGKRVRLAIFGPASALLIRRRLEVTDGAEYVFANSRGEPLTERQARRIVLDACTAAGFPNAERNTLLSAAVAYLSAAGLRDHDLAIVLGIGDMRTVNRLLKPHQALAAQRRVPGGVAYSG